MISRSYILAIISLSLDEKKRVKNFIVTHKNYKNIDEKVLEVYNKLHKELIQVTEELINDITSVNTVFYFYDELYEKQVKLEKLYQKFVEEMIVEKYDINIQFF